MDYRALIKDYHAKQKSIVKSFSYRIFAKKAGYATKTYLIEVTTGRKKLSKKGIIKVSQVMNLTQKEAEYFDVLVNYCHTEVEKEKQGYLMRLNILAGKSNAYNIDMAHFNIFSKWYHVVIRELVTMPDFSGNLSKVAKTVYPPISVKEVKESIELLLYLNFIKKAVSGKYLQTNPSLTTGDELDSGIIRRYQQKLMELSSTALDKVPHVQRDITTLSGSVSKKCFTDIKKEIQIFRKHIQNMMDKDVNQDRVYQINFHLFPLTKIPNKD